MCINYGSCTCLYGLQCLQQPRRRKLLQYRVPDSSAQGSSDTAAADTSDEELSIHYLSARASTEGSLLSLQKIADEYKETHPNFTYEAEIISDRSSYLQKLRILASSDELPEWFDSDADPSLLSL